MLSRFDSFAVVESVPDRDMVFTSRLTGNRLPNARQVSVAIHGETTGPQGNSAGLPPMSILVMQLAQFVDHDLTLTPGKSPSAGRFLKVVRFIFPQARQTNVGSFSPWSFF